MNVKCLYNFKCLHNLQNKKKIGLLQQQLTALKEGLSSKT